MKRQWMLILPASVHRVMLALRWMALALAVGLSFIDRDTEGMLVSTFPLAGGIAAYNGIITVLPMLLRITGRPLLVLALDALVATVAVYLNGGYHSAFFVLYIFVLISVAFYFSVVPSVLLANLNALLYVLACLLNPAGLTSPSATYLLGTKLALLSVVALVTSLLLEQLRHEQQQTAREKNLLEAQATFVSMVSHELRTPVTCIKSSAEMLLAMEQENPDKNRLELLQTIADHSARLESLVSELLQVTKLDTNQMVLTRQPTDLASLLQRTAQAYIPLLSQKGQTLELDLEDGLPRLWVDRARVDQIVGNLLSNAHRFTQPGGHITLRLRQVNEHVHISVSDNGPGIAPEEQERIFEKFYVGHGQRSGAGLGLGLYIARQLAKLHEGDLVVESMPGAGSTFTFSLPILSEEDYDDEVAGSG